MPGPARRPTELNKRLGNPGHRANPAALAPVKLTDANPPVFLDDTAAKEWNRVIPRLVELGLVTDLDLPALAINCTAFSDFLHYNKVVQDARKRNQETYASDGAVWRPIPEVHLRAEAFKQVLRSCAEFGMTPSKRAAMNITLAPKKAPTLKDILDGK